MKLKHRFISILLCLVLVLGIFPALTAPTADAAVGTVLKAGFGLLKFGLKTSLTVSSLIYKNNGDPETSAMLSKWTFPGGTVLVPMLQELGKQMAKMHQEVMEELEFIEDKLDKNMSGIESALGSAAANDAYDNYVSAWSADVTIPMAANGYNQVVNAYKNYLEYAGSYKTGSTVNHAGQQVVATEDMVIACRNAFYSALITMSGAAYDANSGLSYDEYYKYILFETNNIDLKVQATINNLLGRMLNATGAPAGGRYLDRAAQVAFAYFPFSEDQAAFVDAAVQKQAHEINMALLAYQEFIGMRLEHCDAKYKAAEEGGASEEELAALQTKLDNYCTSNANILQLLNGGAACIYPGGVIASMETWLAAPVYISNSDNSFLYLDSYLRATGTQTFSLTNTNFISETDPNVLIDESLDKLISEVIWSAFSGPLHNDPEGLISQPKLTGEQTCFIRRGVVIPTKNGQAVVKPIYMMVDETDDKSGMLMTNLHHTHRPLMSGADYIMPNADFYNFRDGVYTDGYNTYTMTTGSRLKTLTDYTPLSLGGGQLQNYFESVVGTYPADRGLYVLSAATKSDAKVIGHSHYGFNMRNATTFTEEEVLFEQHPSTSYMVVLDSTDNDTYVTVSTLADSGIRISLAGDHYEASTGKAKAGSTVVLTVSPNGNTIPQITAAYQEDATDPAKVTYTQQLLDADRAAEMVGEDGTLAIPFAVPYSNVTLVVGEAGETVCPHPADKRETYYAHDKYGEHGIGVNCTVCGEEVSFIMEDCYDNTSDGKCDVCGYALICPHPEEQRIKNVTNYYGTHSIYEACNACGEDIRNVTEPCTDTNSDGICEVCNGDAECPHSTNWWQSVAVSNDNGTHTVNRTCTNCGHVDRQDTWPCYDGNEDGMCEDCGYVFWCSHPEDKLTKTVTRAYRKHTIYVSCSCGEYSNTVTEDCVDETGDDCCDICGGDLTCDHSDAEPYINCNHDGTHTQGWDCDTCGESEANTSSCYDEDGDGQCDLCYGTMPIETECRHTETTTSYTHDAAAKTHTAVTVCAACGETIETGEAEACTDTDKDKTCDVCSGSIEITVAGTTMNLGNELLINFYLPVSQMDGQGKDLTVYLLHYAEDETIEYVIEKADWVLNKTNYVVSAPVKSTQMSDEIAVIIKDADGYRYNAAYSDSVRGYVGRMAKSTSTTYNRTLMVDMVNYGASSQNYFTYKTDDLANAQLTDEQKSWATASVACTNDDQVEGTNYAGSTLNLKDRILLNVYFKNVGITEETLGDLTATVSFTGYKGNVVNEEVEVKMNSNGLYVEVNQIVLGDSFEPVTVTIYNADGSVYGQGSDSVEAYAYRNSTKELFVNIAKFAFAGREYLLNK